MRLPGLVVVDTNVPKTANLGLRPDGEGVPAECVLACIDAIEHVIGSGGLVLDEGDEIFSEYRNQLSLSGQPGIGDRFLKWVHDHRWSWPETRRVRIHREGECYREFPEHEGLADFDRSDRKFVAVANAHLEGPPILQATDSKWWGWREALEESGVEVYFLCSGYVEGKYREKLGR